jgi:hypothetical protein
MMASILLAAATSLMWSHGNSIYFANAYASEPLSQQRSNAWTGFDIERPLAPPFPNGPCGGKVVTLPRGDLFSRQKESGNPLLNFNRNPFSSFENAVLPPRDIKVWLPKEYHSSEYSRRRFPVLYCHDGQTGEFSCFMAHASKTPPINVTLNQHVKQTLVELRASNKPLTTHPAGQGRR